MSATIDRPLEELALRRLGILGRGGGMGNMLFAMGYELLPIEAKNTIDVIIAGGPFPYPRKDGKRFGNKFGDLPGNGDYLEFTVPTPGANNRGVRRIVARRNGLLFFTACHYERVQGSMDEGLRRSLTERIDPYWRNGFYVITGISNEKRSAISSAIKSLLKV